MGNEMTRRELLRDLAAAGAVGSAGTRVTAAAAQAAAARTRALNARADVWRKMFASLRDDEDVCCWYFGTMFLQPQGVPDIPILHAETLMVYRASAAADGSTRMRWIEIGRFRDPLTGKPAERWLNPYTGLRVATPRSFITRPGEYQVRAGADALAIGLDQDDARVESVEARLTEQDGRIWLQQTERKVRGVPASATTAQIANRPRSVTRLALAADLREIDDPACLSAAASGSYSFETASLPAWAGIDRPGATLVRGIMQKAAADVVVNEESWRELRALYPQFFSGPKVAPRWE